MKTLSLSLSLLVISIMSACAAVPESDAEVLADEAAAIDQCSGGKKLELIMTKGGGPLLEGRRSWTLSQVKRVGDTTETIKSCGSVNVSSATVRVVGALYKGVATGNGKTRERLLDLNAAASGQMVIAMD